MSKTKIVIIGAKGRMGEALVRLAKADPLLEFVAGISRGDDLLKPLQACDVLIDFAHHTATVPLVHASVLAKKGLVIGTTGHTTAEREEILVASRHVPIVLAPNFSVGVNLLFYLSRIAARILGPDYDQEIVEMHHRLKLDAPSGTARRLGEVLAEVAGGSYEELVDHGRAGEVGVRPRRKIGMHALRGGDVVGDHTVIFAAPGERIELTHKASQRDTFAAGALRAARWLVGKKPGLYSMEDVLDLK